MCGVWLVIQIVYSSWPSVPAADGSTHVDRVGNEALVDDALLDHDLGAVDGCRGAVGVTDCPGEGHVVRRVLVELRGAVGGRALGVNHHGQRLPRDVDHVARVDRLLRRLGDDDRDALAGPLHVVDGQDAGRIEVVRDATHLASAGASGGPGAGERIELALGVLAGEHRHDAGHGRGAGRVDGHDFRVRIRRAQDRGVGHAWELDVVEVVAGAGDEPGILGSLDRDAERGCNGHRYLLLAQRLCSARSSPSSSATGPAGAASASSVAGGSGSSSSPPIAMATPPSAVMRAASRMAATMFW